MLSLVRSSFRFSFLFFFLFSLKKHWEDSPPKKIHTHTHTKDDIIYFGRILLCPSSAKTALQLPSFSSLLLGKNIGQNISGCSLMWLMPLRSLSNCDYELKNLPRPNPPQSGDGCWFPSQNPEFPVEFHQSDLSVSIAQLKTPLRHTHVPPVQKNQPGTGFGSQGDRLGSSHLSPR